MAVKQPVKEGVQEVAVSHILTCLHREHRNGRRVFPLVEIAEATALDPTTVEEVMRELESTGPYDVVPLKHGETRWRVEGCVYDLDGWHSDSWNLD